MAFVTVPGTVLPAATSFPEAGVGGTYYNMSFSVPVYFSGQGRGWSQATWQALDQQMLLRSNENTSTGIAAGIACSTLIYLLVLTPNGKRQNLFHQVILFGLVALCMALIVALVAESIPGLSQPSVYLLVTADYASSTWSARYLAINATPPILALIAFVSAIVALFLQARMLMTGMQLRWPRAYRGFLYFLAAIGVVSSIIRTFHITRQIIRLVGNPEQTPGSLRASDEILRKAHMIAYPVCIGAYSLVNFCGAMELLLNRPGGGALQGPTRYTGVVRLIALVSVQSGIIPIIFSVLLLVPGFALPQTPETLLLPSVYLLLPMATVFSSRQVLSESHDVRRAALADLEWRPTGGAVDGGPRPSAVADWTDRELDEIDAMGRGERVARAGSPASGAFAVGN